MKINTKSLRIDRINVNAAELVYLSNKLSETYPAINIYYDLLKKLPEKIFHKIWSTPESYLWSKITWDLVHINEQKSELLNNYLNWTGNPPDKQLELQVEQLGVFIVSAYILMDKEITLENDAWIKKYFYSKSPNEPRYPNITNAFNEGSFPGSGISWSSGKSLQIYGYKNKEICAKERYPSPRYIRWEKVKKSTFFNQPKINGHEMTIDIWSECARMNFDGMEWINRINENDKIDIFKETVEKAMDYIKEYNIDLYNELTLLINKVVPLEVISDANPSSSNSTILGIVFCTYNDDPLLLAEMLIHEFSHNKLFLFQETDPLLDPDVHGDGWKDQGYYSPWRSDPRPLNGILHGLYVFTQVATFWDYVITNMKEKNYEHISSKRFYILIEQLKIAIDVLKHNSTFTDIGDQLINDLNQKIYSFDSKVSKIDLESTSAYFSELDFDRELVGNNVIDAIQMHREKWNKSNNG